MKLGLLDHMGYGNLGDAATQDAVISNIRRRLPNAHIVGFSLVPHDTVNRHGIECHPIRRSSPTMQATDDQAGDEQIHSGSKLKMVLKKSAFIRTLLRPLVQLAREAGFWMRSYRVVRRLDLVVISGGGQLDDLWPDQPYTVFVFALLTRLAGKKLYLMNVGVGPLRRQSDREWTKWVARLAHYCSVRDHDSRERLIQFGVRATTHVFPDLVYSLNVGRLGARTLSRSVKPVVGLNAIGFCDPRIWPRKNESIYQEYLDKIVNFSLWLLDNGYDLRVFTTDIGVDRHAIADLRTRLRPRLSSAQDAQVFPTPSRGVSEVLREMSGFDAVVTSKFHGIVFSHLLRRPVISLSYHRKMDFAMRAVGQERFSASIEHFNFDWLTQSLSTLIDESDQIQAEHAAAVKANVARLSDQFDSLFLAGNPNRLIQSLSTRTEWIENEAFDPAEELVKKRTSIQV